MRTRAGLGRVVVALIVSGLVLSAGPAAADDGATPATSVLSAPVQFAQVQGATLGLPRGRVRDPAGAHSRDVATPWLSGTLDSSTSWRPPGR